MRIRSRVRSGCGYDDQSRDGDKRHTFKMTRVNQWMQWVQIVFVFFFFLLSIKFHNSVLIWEQASSLATRHHLTTIIYFRGNVHMTSALRGGGGFPKIWRKGGCVDLVLVTENTKNLADVICTCHLNSSWDAQDAARELQNFLWIFSIWKWPPFLLCLISSLLYTISHTDGDDISTVKIKCRIII